MKTFLYSLVLGCISMSANGATQTVKNLRELSLEELMNVEVSVSSKTREKSLRESPGIISVITSEDIANSGARDLIDVLNLVPGFSFGVDVFNVVGAGIRGNWGFEGKILLLIDGIQMNEHNYGVFALGNHYPIEHIDKIEIIRGPGSVIYGGFAELGVINIITKNAEKIDGTQINLMHGQMQKNIGRQNLSFMHGETLKNNLKVSAAGYVGRGQRSDELYTDSQGSSISMNNNSSLNPHFINLGLQYGNFSSRLLIDNYRMTSGEGYGLLSDSLCPTLCRMDFKTWSYQAKYTRALTDNLKLAVDSGYTRDIAWKMDNGIPEDFTKTVIEHLWLKNSLLYSLSKEFDIASGLEINYDKTVDRSAADPKAIPHFHYYSLFVEGDYKSDLGSITLGARYDNHNLFGGNLAPRIALTKIMDKLHYKLLYSHSFRSPMAYNVAFNPDIKPEKTTVLEAEMGYQIHKNMNITVNVFDNKTKDTIIYDLLPLTNQETYFNANKTGTRGIEAEWRFKDDWGNVSLSHSYYRSGVGTARNQRVINFQENTEEALLHLGFPAHKTVLSFNFKLAPYLNLNSSIVYQSVRYGYDGVDENGLAYLKKYNASPLVNAFLRYQPPEFKGLELGFGIFDLFNSKPHFIQPYSSSHSPLPAPSRELVFKLGYQF